MKKDIKLDKAIEMLKTEGYIVTKRNRVMSIKQANLNIKKLMVEVINSDSHEIDEIERKINLFREFIEFQKDM